MANAAYSSLAQSVERMTVNHDVAGSSPAGGARKKHLHFASAFFNEAHLMVHEKWSRASPYEAWLRHTEKISLRFASYERMGVHRGNEVAASYLRSKCFIDKMTIFSGVSMTVWKSNFYNKNNLAFFWYKTDTNVC